MIVHQLPAQEPSQRMRETEMKRQKHKRNRISQLSAHGKSTKTLTKAQGFETVPFARAVKGNAKEAAGGDETLWSRELPSLYIIG